MSLLEWVRQDTDAEFRLKGTHSTKGAEYAGPCPLCGGTDRFLVWPDHPEGPQFACMAVGARAGCGIGGGEYTYLMTVRGLSKSDAWKTLYGTGDGAVCGRRKLPRGEERRRDPAILNVQPPSEAWQGRALSYVQYAERTLWSDAGRDALEYLRVERGLSDESIRHFRLGYYPLGKYGFNHDKNKEAWGPEMERHSNRKSVVLPPGIVIPSFADGHLWYVKVRVPHLNERAGSLDRLCAYLGYAWSWKRRGETVYYTAKYCSLPGPSGRVLFNADNMTRYTGALLLCEGEFDTMLAWQQARHLIDVSTLGGAAKANQGIPWRWYLRMWFYHTLLVAYDVDRNHGGDLGAARLAQQTKRAVRVQVPVGTDITDYWRAGNDVAVWVLACLSRAEHWSNTDR